MGDAGVILLGNHYVFDADMKYLYPSYLPSDLIVRRMVPILFLLPIYLSLHLQNDVSILSFG